MKEAFGNIWELATSDDVIVITTNGYVNKKGEAVMGRGIALQAATRKPEVSKILGHLLTKYGNHVHTILADEEGEADWYSFPVKHHWSEKADLELIERSCQELVFSLESDFMNWDKTVYLPRPGCGNGHRNWAEVKPILEKHLTDDKFIVVTYDQNE